MDDPMPYDRWVKSVLNNPFKAGWAGVALATATIATLLALLAEFCMFAASPSVNSYLNSMMPSKIFLVILVLPLIVATLGVFYVLSRVFYALYCRSDVGTRK